MEMWYELGKQDAIKGYPRRKFKPAGDNAWYYEFGFREIVAVGWK